MSSYELFIQYLDPSSQQGYNRAFLSREYQKLIACTNCISVIFAMQNATYNELLFFGRHLGIGEFHVNLMARLDGRY